MLFGLKGNNSRTKIQIMITQFHKKRYSTIRPLLYRSPMLRRQDLF